MRECNIYDFNGRFDLYEKNTGICRDTLVNGHWEELIRKVKELLYATDHPDNNYCMVIQQIIQYSSNSEQCLKSFLKLYVIKYVHDVIKTMLSSGASGCASILVDTGRQSMVDIWVDKSSSNC